MSINRKLVKIDTPEGRTGFLGPDHIARQVVSGPFGETDPFILLMDDRLDKKDDQPIGGPHPHAGFETVSLLLEGEIGDGVHKMKEGGFQMMTAGSGIIHTETIQGIATMRLLQLWLNLPKEHRNAVPRLQELPLEHVPVLSQNGVTIRLYSGTLAGLSSPVQNYTPVIIADLTIDAGITSAQQIPANYNTFMYVIKGDMRVGEGEELLRQDQVGWLDLFTDNGMSDLKLSAGAEGVRLVLYSGKPTGDPIISHGPFISDSSEGIQRLYQEYRQGMMKHISAVPDTQRLYL